MRHATLCTTLTACLGLVACSAPTTHVASTPQAPIVARTPVVEPPPVESVLATAPVEAAPSITTCLSEETETARRTEACEAYLAGSEGAAILDPNVLSERADAMRALHMLGHAAPIPRETQRLLAGRLDHCVMVGASSRVVSLVCRMASCGDPRGSHAFELDSITGELKGQQC